MGRETRPNWFAPQNPRQKKSVRVGHNDGSVEALLIVVAPIIDRENLHQVIEHNAGRCHSPVTSVHR